MESSPDSSWPHVSEEGIAWGRELPTAPNSTEILHTINSTLFFSPAEGFAGPAEPGGVTDIPDRSSPTTPRQGDENQRHGFLWKTRF